jgi:hypothetical protein
MDGEIKPGKYRRLSITALVTGILTICVGFLYNILWLPLTNFMQVYIDSSMMPYIVLPVLVIVFFLAITSVTCGSIDLNRINKGIYNRKGKGFDITGIVLGGLFILLVSWVLLGELLVPH